MALARTAAQYMLSDALLPDRRGPRLKGLRLELPLDRVVKLVAVGFPLLLVSLAFAREFSGPPVSCFCPANFSARQAAYTDSACWDSLVHHEPGPQHSTSLWPHKALPYSLLALAVAMFLPALLWQCAAVPALGSDLLLIISELDKSYNRSVRLGQHLPKTRQESPDPHVFWDELDRRAALPPFPEGPLGELRPPLLTLARKQRYFEFPLLERYLACKQRSHSLVATYLLRNVLLLLLTSATYLYLGHFHLGVFFQEEFSCSIKTELLSKESQVPDLITCRLTSLSIFQVASLASAAVCALLVPLITYNLTRLCRWDKRLLSVYEMLPAFDLLSRKMLGCPINDLNMILLFLRANISELISFSWLSVLCVLKDTTSQTQNIDTVVDFMTLLAGLEPSKPTHLTH